MNHPPTSPITGLSEADAQQRRSQGLGNNVEVKTGRTYGQIVRGNLFTFFNIVLFSLAALLLLLGSPRDALYRRHRAAQRRDCHRAGGARQAQTRRDLPAHPTYGNGAARWCAKDFGSGSDRGRRYSGGRAR
ncbi:MAG: hypothetical protein IPM07_00605 [Anaerolineales bacterium]|nr:hypothetical protein [Anaerolineales bacterium]